MGLIFFFPHLILLFFEFLKSGLDFPFLACYYAFFISCCKIVPGAFLAYNREVRNEIRFYLKFLTTNFVHFAVIYVES